MKCEELLSYLNGMPRITRENVASMTEKVVGLISAFRSMDPADREAITKGLSESTHGAFGWFELEAAVAAVTRNSPDLIVAGLMMMAIESGGRDYRDNIKSMAALFHSACKLGMNTEQAFADAAHYATRPEYAELMRKFPKRKPKKRDLAAFYLREKITAEGFGYEEIPFKPVPRSPRSRRWSKFLNRLRFWG